ncbi:unnamed protein product [Rotaria sp. Silwood2]|nr:unnamed protein product [Rotaria sp. Silwood2]CAF4436081.1 unnamed protein product [Rotaria sp. Silwood2]
MDQIEVTHDLFQQTLSQQMAEPQQQALFKKIDEWENESITKIKTMAEESRSILLQHTSGHLTEVKQKIERLTNELRQGKQSNDFTEIDLREWEDKFKKLQEELTHPNGFSVRLDSEMLVAKVRVDVPDSSETFERTFGNTTFEEGSKIVIKDSTSSHTEVRGKNEYTTGQRTLRFKVEQLGGNGWIAFGIMSQTTALQQDSYRSQTSYGWSNREQVYTAGSHASGQGSEVIENDTVSLLIDCEHQLIQLTNERTNRTIKQAVDISKCPFPWQLHINLHQALTRVRIIS